MPIELKPCPFCGGKAEKNTVHDLGVHAGHIHCGKCGARTAAYFIGKDEGAEFVVIEAWNKRAERTCTMTYDEEWSGEELYPTEAFICSECGGMTVEGMPKFCPNCGARVEGRE